MPNELPLPEDIAHLLEKRETEDRRQSTATNEDTDQQLEGTDRRSGGERRSNTPNEE